MLDSLAKDIAERDTATRAVLAANDADLRSSIARECELVSNALRHADAAIRQIVGATEQRLSEVKTEVTRLSSVAFAGGAPRTAQHLLDAGTRFDLLDKRADDLERASNETQAAFSRMDALMQGNVS